MKPDIGVFKKASILSIIVALVLIFSCKKEPDCYECTTTFQTTLIYEGESEVSSISDTQKFCDMTEEEIMEYEIRNTNTTSFESSGVTNIIVKTTTCTK
jgi:hypothetical protein